MNTRLEATKIWRTLKGHIKGQRETADKLLQNLCKWTSEQGLEKDVNGAKRC